MSDNAFTIEALKQSREKTTFSGIQCLYPPPGRPPDQHQRHSSSPVLLAPAPTSSSLWLTDLCELGPPEGQVRVGLVERANALLQSQQRLVDLRTLQPKEREREQEKQTKDEEKEPERVGQDEVDGRM